MYGFLRQNIYYIPSLCIYAEGIGKTYHLNSFNSRLQTMKERDKGLHNIKLYATIIISVMLAGSFAISSITASSVNNVLIKSSGTIATTLPLHVEGRYIKDSLGRTVLLRGVNQAGMLDDPNGWWNPEGGTIYSGLGNWNPEAVEYNFDRMKSWGINVVRLLLTVEWWKNDEANYRQHIKDSIAWAGERGIYVLVVFWNVQGNGGPDPLPFPPYSIDGSEIIVSDVDGFVNVWRSVAQELSPYPNVLFELWNEPHGDSSAKEAWFNAVQDCITSIRSTSAQQIIVVQWDYGIWVNLDFDSGSKMDWVEQYPLNDSSGNIVYSTHMYRNNIHSTIPERVNSYEYDDLKEGHELCLVPHVLYNLNKPVLIGEVGANMWWTGEELEQELAYFNNSLTIYNEWEIGYIGWVWTATAHMQHGLLQNDHWCPPPTQSGEILISKIAEGQ